MVGIKLQMIINNNVRSVDEKSRFFISLPDILGWLVLLAVTIFVFSYMLPRKGVGFADEGWFLSAALFAAEGLELDTLIPPAPHYLVNATLMSIGIQNYLHLRYAYYLFIALSMYLFLTGLRRGQNGCYVVPVGIAFGLLTSFQSLISYKTAPVLFLLMALGLIFRCLDTQHSRWISVLLSCLAGFFLGLSSFVNFTIFPAAVLCCTVIWLSHRSNKIVLIMVSVFLTTFALFAGWYLSKIGLTEFLRPLGGHVIVWRRIFSILEYAAVWPVFCVCLFGTILIGKYFFPRHWHWFKTISDILRILLPPLVSLLFLMLIIGRLFDYNIYFFDNPMFKYIGDKLTEADGRLVRLARLIAFFGWAMLSLVLVAGVRKTTTFNRVALCAFIISTYWINQAFFSGHSYFESSIVYAGPMLALVIYFVHHTFSVKDTRWPMTFAISIILTVCFGISSCALYSIYYNHSNYIPIYVEKRELFIPRLEGIMETPERAHTLEQLTKVYERFDCHNKIFITAQNTPLLHYIFDKKAPRGIGYIRPITIYPEKRIFEELNSKGDWCVFYSKNYNEQRGEERKLKTLLEYLAENSKKIIRLREGPPRHKHDDFVIYIGPSRSGERDICDI